MNEMNSEKTNNNRKFFHFSFKRILETTIDEKKKLLTPIKNLRRVRSKQKSLKIYLSLFQFFSFPFF